MNDFRRPILVASVLTGLALGQIVPEVIYYKFNEGSGTSAVNAALPGGGSAVGTVGSGLSWGPGKFGTGIVGANTSASTASVTTGYNFALQGQSWTIEFWFNPGGTTSLQYLFGNSSGGGGNFRGWCGAAPGSTMLISGNGLASNSIAGSVPSPGTWVHYAWVFNATVSPPTITPYLNGVPYAPIAQTAALTLNTGSLIVGGYATSNCVLGTLDDFRLWLRARTAAEILASYNMELVSENLFTAQTTGGGTGDLSLSLTMINPTAVEGLMLVTTATTGSLGTGPLLGIEPDALTWSIFNVASAPGNPLHFPLGVPGVFPDQPLLVPPGTLSFLAGQTWDAVMLMVGPGYSYAGRSAVQRLVW